MAGFAGLDGQPGAEAVTEGELSPALQNALDKFTLDVTAKAREGKIDPVFGRDSEIHQIPLATTLFLKGVSIDDDAVLQELFDVKDIAENGWGIFSPRSYLDRWIPR